jgi:hypothetical protein
MLYPELMVIPLSMSSSNSFTTPFKFASISSHFSFPANEAIKKMKSGQCTSSGQFKKVM